MKDLPIVESIQKFEHLSELIFRARGDSSRTCWLWKAVQILESLLSDGRYASRNLEKALEDVLGDASMIDCSRLSGAGVRIGIPVATISTQQALVLANYRSALGRSVSGMAKFTP